MNFRFPARSVIEVDLLRRVLSERTGHLLVGGVDPVHEVRQANNGRRLP